MGNIFDQYKEKVDELKRKEQEQFVNDWEESIKKIVDTNKAPYQSTNGTFWNVSHTSQPVIYTSDRTDAPRRINNIIGYDLSSDNGSGAVTLHRELDQYGRMRRYVTVDQYDGTTRVIETSEANYESVLRGDTRAMSIGGTMTYNGLPVSVNYESDDE